jgi:hypothetical protein
MEISLCFSLKWSCKKEEKVTSDFKKSKTEQIKRQASAKLEQVIKTNGDRAAIKANWFDFKNELKSQIISDVESLVSESGGCHTLALEDKDSYLVLNYHGNKSSVATRVTFDEDRYVLTVDSPRVKFSLLPTDDGLVAWHNKGIPFTSESVSEFIIEQATPEII